MRLQRGIFVVVGTVSLLLFRWVGEAQEIWPSQPERDHPKIQQVLEGG